MIDTWIPIYRAKLPAPEKEPLVLDYWYCLYWDDPGCSDCAAAGVLRPHREICILCSFATPKHGITVWQHGPHMVAGWLASISPASQ